MLYVDDTVLLCEWGEGEVWTSAHFDADDNLSRVANALREIHALPLTGKTFDAAAAAQLYAGSLDASMSGAAERHLAVVEAAPGPMNLCCCHNDLVAENIIATPDIRFLDWEYACDNDPLFDLAVIIAHHGLSRRQEQVLLDAYFDGNGEPWRRQLGVQMRLYNALNWLWAVAGTSVAEPE